MLQVLKPFLKISSKLLGFVLYIFFLHCERSWFRSFRIQLIPSTPSPSSHIFIYKVKKKKALPEEWCKISKFIPTLPQGPEPIILNLKQPSQGRLSSRQDRCRFCLCQLPVSSRIFSINIQGLSYQDPAKPVKSLGIERDKTKLVSLNFRRIL